VINISLPQGAAIDDEGVYTQVLSHPSGSLKRPALFLDRDGVVVVEAHYLHKVEDAKLIPGAARIIALATRADIPVILITNQAGIGYGYFGWNEFILVQDKILSDLSREGASVSGVFACPHHARGKPPYNHPDHPARKPNPGMLLKAAEMMSIDLPASWVVGDRAIDMEAGRNAGLSGGLHVLTGHGSREGERDAALAMAGKEFTVHTGESINDADRMLPIFASLT